MKDLSAEIELQTTRSGGKGGQNVNKVETAVIAFFPIGNSILLTEEEKSMLRQQLKNRVNAADQLFVKAQTFRTQLENKKEAIRKINFMVSLALEKKKMRIATKPTKGSRVKNSEQKQKLAERKAHRRKFKPGDY